MVITPLSLWSLGPMLRGAVIGAPTAVAYPSANKAFFIPFRVPKIVTAYQIVVGNGTTSGNNIDAGIYDEFGNRLVRAGSTARGAGSEQVLNIADTVLLPGMYYMAYAHNSTNNVVGFSSSQAGLIKALGVKEMASGFSTGLVDPATYATPTHAWIPAIAIHLKGWA